MRATGQKPVSVRLPEDLIKGLQELIESGKYMNESDAVREAIRNIIKEERTGRPKN